MLVSTNDRLIFNLASTVLHLFLIFYREFSFKVYPENMVVVVQYNILKIFTMHFSKIDQIYIYFILYCSFINE